MVHGDIIHSEAELPALPARIWCVDRYPYLRRRALYISAAAPTPLGTLFTVEEIYQNGRHGPREPVLSAILFEHGHILCTKPRLALKVIADERMKK